MPRFALAAFLLLLGRAAPAVAQDWIRLVGGPSYQLPGNTLSPITVPIPIQLTDVAPESVSVELRDLMFNNRHETAFFQAFACPSDSTGCLKLGRLEPHTGLSIIVPFDPKHGGGQGTYTLSLQASTKGKNPVALQVQVVDPAAKLRPVPKLKLVRVKPDFLRNNRDSVPLHLEEVAGTAIPDLQPRLRDFPDRVVDDSAISLGTYKGELAGEDTTTVPLLIRGKWPLGTNSGAIEVRSHQLTDPLKIDIEVLQRWTSLFIVLVAAVGIALGYLIRIVLARRVQEEDAKAKANDLLARLQADRELKLDANFQAAVGTIIQKLESAVQKGVPWWETEAVSPLQKAVEEAQAQWEAARRQLEEKRAKAQVDLVALSPVATTAWSLPEEFRAVQSKVGAGIANAMQQLDVFDAKAACATLVQTIAECRDALEERVPEWRLHVGRGVEWLKSRPPLQVDSSVAEHAIAAADAAAALLAKVKAPGPSPGASDLASVLTGIHEVRTNLVDLSNQLRLWISLASGQVISALQRSQTVDPAALADINKAATAVDDGLRAGQDSPEDLPVFLGSDDRLIRLAEVTEDVLSAALEVLRPEDRAATEPLVRERHYVEAARRIEAASRIRTARSRAQTPDSGPAAYPLVGWIPSRHPVVGTPLSYPLRVDFRPPAVGFLQVQGLKALFSARLVRTLLIGVLILLAGYTLFKPGFVGTFDDLVKVFFWGFSLDVTLDTLTRVIPKVSS